MSETTQIINEDDASTPWSEGEPSLEQSDIDNLFGNSSQDGSHRRRGFEALITNVVSGIDRMPMLNIMIDRLAQSMTVSMRGFTGDTIPMSASIISKHAA